MRPLPPARALAACALLLAGAAAAAEPAAERTSYALGVQFGRDTRQIASGIRLDAPAFVSGVRDALAGRKFRLPTQTMSSLLLAFERNRAGKPEAAASKDTSYSLGVHYSRHLSIHKSRLRMQNFSQGIEDALTERPLRLEEPEIAKLLLLYREDWLRQWRELGDKNREQGRRFLAENRNREGVTELADGLLYEILREGQGKRPGLSDIVRVHYRGALIDGEEFDSSHRGGAPATLPLKRTIRGWQLLLPEMRVGAKWRAYIPPALGYGREGAPPTIGPDATLVFEIELLGIEERSAADKDPS